MIRRWHGARCRGLVVVVCLVAMAPVARGQSWISFANQTSVRLADPEGNYDHSDYSPVSQLTVLQSDTQEKDFAVGDVDNDGDGDVILVRKQPYSTQGKRKSFLFLNENGVLTNRTMAKAAQLLELTNNRDAALVDVTGDGWLDLVTAPSFPAGAVSGQSLGFTTDPPSIWMPRVYVNLGADASGTWLGLSYNYADQRIPDYTGNQYPFFSSITFGDVDHDGDEDLFFTDFASDSSVPDPPGGPLRNRLLLNNGAGFFTDVSATNLLNPSGSPSTDIRGNGFGTRGKLADMNGDSWVDLLADDACSANPRTVRYAQNLGSATPPQPGVFMTGFFSNITVGNSVTDIAVGDINADGKLDFYAVDDSNDGLYLNNGNNSQNHPTFVGVTPPGQTASTTSAFGGNNYSVDMDNDGRLDEIVCDEDIDLALGGNRMVLLHNTGASPWLTLAGDPFTLDGTLGTRDTYDAAVLDINGDGLLDLWVGSKTANKVFIQVPDTIPPTILSSTPASGTLDALQDRGSNGALQGISQVTITFSEPVRDAVTNGPVSPASFQLSLATGLPGLTPPAVVSVAASADNTGFTLTLDRPITPGAWNTITANVEDVQGNALADSGIDLAFLPGDCDHSGTANTVDLLACLNGLHACTAAGTCSAPAVLSQFDVDRSGAVTTADLLRVVQLLNGVNTQNVWNGVSLPPQP